MSINLIVEIFGLLWQSSMCTENPIYQLCHHFIPVIPVIGNACLKLNLVHISLLTGKYATPNLKILRHSSLWHVEIL